jgi:hypothetical protein
MEPPSWRAAERYSSWGFGANDWSDHPSDSSRSIIWLVCYYFLSNYYKATWASCYCPATLKAIKYEK